jgi:WD40 repeat protein
MFLAKPSVPKRYKLAGKIGGHTDSVHSLAITKNGRILASGGSWCHVRNGLMTNLLQGSDGVRLWNIETLDELRIPNQNYGRLGPTTCVVWLTRTENLDEMLCYATGLGYVVFWEQEKKRVRDFP